MSNSPKIISVPSEQYSKNYTEIFGDRPKRLSGHHREGSDENKKDRTFNVNTGNWVEGWYEHIDSKPIYIHNKKHLIHECNKRGLLAKAFMKPKSQGAGFEHGR